MTSLTPENPGSAWLSKIALAVSGTLIATGFVAGFAVWRDVAVIQTRLNDLNASVVRVLDDHEARIRSLEKL